jgi:ribose-phosphate pyrophosphokinase
LAENGAVAIYGCATHALLSRNASQRLQDAPFKEVCVTNTVHIAEQRKFPKLKVLPVGDLLGKAIAFTHNYQSVSSLFSE